MLWFLGSDSYCRWILKTMRPLLWLQCLSSVKISLSWNVTWAHFSWIHWIRIDKSCFIGSISDVMLLKEADCHCKSKKKKKNSALMFNKNDMLFKQSSCFGWFSLCFICLNVPIGVKITVHPWASWNVTMWPPHCFIYKGMSTRVRMDLMLLYACKKILWRFR